MTSAPVEQPVSPLRARMAEEIRALLARRRIAGVALAARIHRSQSYVSRRLTGDIPFDVDDLEAIARVLGVTVADLLPSADRRTGQPTASKVGVADRPRDNRPKTRGAKGVDHGPGVRRTNRTRALTQEERSLCAAQGSRYA